MEEMKEVEAREERQAAEDLRRQLQERCVRSNEGPGRADQLRWVDENRDLLANIMTVSFNRAPDAGPTVVDFRKELENVVLPTEHDEPFTHSIMHMHCKEIENACHELEIPLRSGVAYGSSPDLDISAERCAVQLTDASIVSLSTGFISFCSHVSKVFALSLPHEEGSKGIKVTLRPELVLQKIGSDEDLKRLWTSVIGAYAYGSGPLDAEHRVVPYPASIVRAQLLSAM